MKKNNILIIAPHADDEILGCGGYISKNVKNYNIFILILTNASKSQNTQFSNTYINKIRQEALQCHKYAGIKKTFFEEFPAPMLDQTPAYLISEAISSYIKQVSPSKVFLPFYGDTHIDHRIIYEASMVAIRPFLKNNIKSVYCYETLSETEFGIQKNNYFFNPNTFIALSKKDILKKIKFFNFYKSQKKSYPHPRSLKSIDILSQYRGLMSNNNYAEAFLKIREYE